MGFKKNNVGCCGCATDGGCADCGPCALPASTLTLDWFYDKFTNLFDGTGFHCDPTAAGSVELHPVAYCGTYGGPHAIRWESFIFPVPTPGTFTTCFDDTGNERLSASCCFMKFTLYCSDAGTFLSPSYYADADGGEFYTHHNPPPYSDTVEDCFRNNFNTFQATAVSCSPVALSFGGAGTPCNGFHSGILTA